MVQERVLRNDARILDAAITLAASGGWSAMTIAGVGQAAGLSKRPVRDRFATPTDVGATAWANAAGPALQGALERALQAAGLLDEPASEAAFAESMDALTFPDDRLKAAAELVVVSCFEPKLRAVVEASLVAAISAWLDVAAAGSPTRAARRGYLLTLALGLLATRRPGIDTLDLHCQWRRLLACLHVERAPVELPQEPRPEFLVRLPFDTGDAITDDLLRAAIDRLGTHGYEGTILVDVAADAGVTEATIYLRYPTKEAFIMDAINRQQDITLPGQREYFARLERAHGAGIADAVAMRDTLHPRERPINIIEMERARLTWHRASLAEADEERLQQLVRTVLAEDPSNPDFADPARLHLARALGMGVAFMPLVDEHAWALPFDVVTVPLQEASNP